MNNILEKLGSYQLLTNLLPGAFFGLAIKYFFNMDLPTENVGEDIVVYYFIGLFISRIGSLVIEPVLKKIRLIKFAKYADFAKAVKSDTKIDILSEMNNYLRSLLTCVMLLPVVKIAQVLSSHWLWFSTNWKWFVIVILFMLLLFSYRKQSKYVRNRVEAVNSQAENKSKDG